MASRRRRRKSIGKVIVDAERRIRRIEKRPGSRRLKNNVVTTEKIGYRAVQTKYIDKDAVTADEAAFGVPVVSPTQPTDNLKEGTLWVDPTDGAASVYDPGSSSFISVTDATAQSIAASKNTTYVQADEPTGGTYSVGDLWIDINDGNKLYAWSGTAWVARQDGDIAFAQSTADGKNTIYRQTTAPTGGTYATGDLWFDTDDNNKIYRYNGTDWSTAVQLGGNALANVNANTITAGTIDASVITVSNINAGNITTGKINTGLITVSTSPTATGNTARVEMTSLGFFAYNGNVATVSITNTGTAVLSGTVNASGGNFTGFVTGGTMRFGADVNSTNDGIYINANNYWYDTGTFKVGDATSFLSFSSGVLTVAGTITSASTIAGTSASTVVSGAAEGATALQEGNGVSKNASDQIVSISTGGIRIGTAPTATGNTARVEINSSGFYAYDGSIATVSISSSGSASFRGNVIASSFSTVSGTTAGIAIGSVTGAETIDFYRASALSGRIYASATGFGLFGSAGNSIIFTSSGGIQIQNSAATQGLLLSSGSTVTIQNDSSTIAAVRNIEVTTTATSHNDSATGYLVGDVRLVRQA